MSHPDPEGGAPPVAEQAATVGVPPQPVMVDLDRLLDHLAELTQPTSGEYAGDLILEDALRTERAMLTDSGNGAAPGDVPATHGGDG